ncbi:MAG TPA: recombination protein O N-terminal domain-containing protein [Edaphocola sp.]|nr:recombination protein O N-terminal domain-containing protein [Edaphocola sp.]
MIIGTKGIVLKVVKYGDTSIICNIFTELLGLQAYLIKGVRSQSKHNAKGVLFRSGNILEMQVYHQDSKAINYIKEYHLDYFFKGIGEDVIKNAIMLFCVEVLGNFVTTPDAQEDLFYFTVDFLKKIDTLDNKYLANAPIYFLKETSRLMGYAFSEQFDEEHCFFNPLEGNFQQQQVLDTHGFDKRLSFIIFNILNERSLENVLAFHLESIDRKSILEAYLIFLQWHDKSFKPLKSLPVLQAILH